MSISASDFEFAGYQAAGFYSRILSPARSLLPKLLSDLGDVLDGDPMTLPIPAEAPPEIPRLSLVSKDQRLRVDVSLLRVDLRWQRGTDTLALDTFVQLVNRLFATLRHATETDPGRLAIILHRFRNDPTPGRALASHFCRPELLVDTPKHKGPLNRPEAFELHAFKRFQSGRFAINSWFRAKTAMLKPPGATIETPIILVEQDLNTPQEEVEETRFNLDTIAHFFTDCAAESDRIMDLYFSEPGRAK